MTKTKVTRHAVAMSFLSLMLCVSMLLGTTFAWFTDSVTSAGNIIKSGTLDVEMYYANGTEAVPADGDTAWNDASTGAIFNYDLWEPGYTEVRHIQIKNVGTLALKYKVQIVANGTVSNLADVIDVYYMDPAEQVESRSDLAAKTPMGTLKAALDGMDTTATGNLLAGQAHTITIALKMQEDAGNEYQNKSIGTDFSIQLIATQLTYEDDSFDELYDETSVFPVLSIGHATMTAPIDTASSDVLAINTNGEIQSASVPAAAANAYYEAAGAATNKEVTLNLNVAKTGETTTSAGTTVALDIDMDAVINLDGTVTTSKIESLTDYVTINYTLGTGKSNVEVTHKGNEMEALASADATPTNVNGGYFYNDATGILTIKTKSFSPFEVSYKVKNLIPIGGVYYTGVESTALGTYTGENVQAYIGDGISVEFPESVNCGDVYVYGDYEYRYQYFFGSISGFYAVNALEDGWHQNSEDAKWYARVLDKTKTSYGPILETINGEVINGLTHTFLNCTNMVVAPSLPDTVYALEQTFFGCTSLTMVPNLPSNGTVLSATFKGCTSLVDAPALPENAVSMISTFHSCTSLENAPAIPEGVQDLTLAFYATAITSAPVLPSTARNIQFIFRDCASLSSFENSGDGYLIPDGVTNMQGAFYNCSALSGHVIINANPTAFNNCFANCGNNENHAITLSGSSSMRSNIAATGGEFVTEA